MGSKEEEERKSALQNSAHLEPLGGTPVKERMSKHARMDSPYPDTQVDAHMSGTVVLEVPPGLPAGSADGGGGGGGNGDGGGLGAGGGNGDGGGGGSGGGLPGAHTGPAISVESMFQQMLSKMSTVNETVSGVKAEVAHIRVNMVPRSEFTAHIQDMNTFKQEVETKFANLSVTGSAGDGGTAALKQAVAKQARALDRLDVAHKSVCLDGFALDMTASARMADINKFMQQHFAGVPVIKVESVFTGARGSRGISKKTVVEFQSQNARDQVLSEMKAKHLQFSCAGHPISIAKAKTQKQLDRNAVLFQALDKIKAHVSAQGKACSIEWIIQDSWNREVQVDKETAFVQKGGEMMGCFVGPFGSLAL